MTTGLIFQVKYLINWQDPKFLCDGISCSLEDACKKGKPYIIDPDTKGMSATR